MKLLSRNLAISLGLAALGVALAAAGLYVGATDDAPGAALPGILLVLGALVFAVRFALSGLESGRDVDPKKKRARLLRAGVATIVLAVCAAGFVAGVFGVHGFTSRPSVRRQSEEVAALETHVLPLVKDLGATWYLNEGFGDGSIHWKGGKFTKDPARARQDGDALFDQATEGAFEQFSKAIRASGVPTNRLREATFTDDGTLRTAVFKRRGGGLEFVFTYIYSPGTKPEEWKSALGPVVLTRIGDSDWWFEQSPDD